MAKTTKNILKNQVIKGGIKMNFESFWEYLNKNEISTHILKLNVDNICMNNKKLIGGQTL